MDKLINISWSLLLGIGLAAVAKGVLAADVAAIAYGITTMVVIAVVYALIYVSDRRSRDPKMPQQTTSLGWTVVYVITFLVVPALSFLL